MAIVGGDQGHRKQGQQFGDVEDSWQIVGGPLNVQSTEHFRKNGFPEKPCWCSSWLSCPLGWWPVLGLLMSHRCFR